MCTEHVSLRDSLKNELSLKHCWVTLRENDDFDVVHAIEEFIN